MMFLLILLLTAGTLPAAYHYDPAAGAPAHAAAVSRHQAGIQQVDTTVLHPFMQPYSQRAINVADAITRAYQYRDNVLGQITGDYSVRTGSATRDFRDHPQLINEVRRIFQGLQNLGTPSWDNDFKQTADLLINRCEDGEFTEAQSSDLLLDLLHYALPKVVLPAFPAYLEPGVTYEFNKHTGHILYCAHFPAPNGGVRARAVGHILAYNRFSNKSICTPIIKSLRQRCIDTSQLYSSNLLWHFTTALLLTSNPAVAWSEFHGFNDPVGQGLVVGELAQGYGRTTYGLLQHINALYPTQEIQFAFNT